MYEDVLIETADVKLALSRLPADVLNAREQRLKRAMVLSSQQRYLPDEVAEKIDPWQPYLQPYPLGRYSVLARGLRAASPEHREALALRPGPTASTYTLYVGLNVCHHRVRPRVA